MAENCLYHEEPDDNRLEIYPYSAAYVAEAFKCEYEEFEGYQPYSALSRSAIKWLAQYIFWYKHEKFHGVPWKGGHPPDNSVIEEADHPDDEFGPASWMWPPANWRLYENNKELFRKLLIEFDQGGNIVRVGIWCDCQVLHRRGLNQLAENFHVRTDRCATKSKGWADFYFEATGPVCFHVAEEDNEARPRRRSFSGGYGNEPNPYLSNFTSEEYRCHHRTRVPRGSTQRLTSDAWYDGLGTLKLEPAPDTHLVGFETTKLQISTSCQISLMANAHRELVSLEEQSKARILIFDPFYAQDGKVSDTALVFIQGSPHTRNQAVRLITAFQTNLETMPLHSNFNFAFLGPGRSRGRKKNGQKRVK